MTMVQRMDKSEKYLNRTQLNTKEAFKLLKHLGNNQKEFAHLDKNVKLMSIDTYCRLPRCIVNERPESIIGSTEYVYKDCPLTKTECDSWQQSSTVDHFNLATSMPYGVSTIRFTFFMARSLNKPSLLFKINLDPFLSRNDQLFVRLNERQVFRQSGRQLLMSGLKNPALIHIDLSGIGPEVVIDLGFFRPVLKYPIDPYPHFISVSVPMVALTAKSFFSSDHGNTIIIVAILALAIVAIFFSFNQLTKIAKVCYIWVSTTLAKLFDRSATVGYKLASDKDEYNKQLEKFAVYL